MLTEIPRNDDAKHFLEADQVYSIFWKPDKKLMVIRMNTGDPKTWEVPDITEEQFLKTVDNVNQAKLHRY